MSTQHLGHKTKMKVTATRTRHKTSERGICNWNKGDTYDVMFNNAEFCCWEMKSAFGSGHAGRDEYLGFGEAERYGRNKVEAVCIYHTSVYPEGAYTHELPIKFCPFCSAEIVVEVIEAEQEPTTPQ